MAAGKRRPEETLEGYHYRLRKEARQAKEKGVRMLWCSTREVKTVTGGVKIERVQGTFKHNYK